MNKIVIIRESCILLDDIMTHSQHLNDLRGEIAMEVIDNHEVSLKKLKKLFGDKSHAMTEDDRNKMVVLYQTLKRQLTDFYEMVDEFRNNHNNRPSYLDYNKMKMKGIDSLKKWSEETNEYVIDKKDGNGAQGGEKDSKKDPADEIDLLGLGDEVLPSPPKQGEAQINANDASISKNKLPPPPGSKAEKKPAQNEDNFDLLGTDFGAPQISPSQPIKQPTQTNQANTLDLFDLNLNLYDSSNHSGNTNAIEIGLDDDFFALIANKKNQLQN